MGFKRYSLNDVHNSRFYQLPKFLFEREFKRGLSSDAKMLYALLRDRHELSISNNWVNKNNEVYLIYTREEMCDMIGCKMDKIRKLINELKNASLMEEERQGLSKPNLIFLNYIDINSYENTSTSSNNADYGKTVVKTTEKPYLRESKNRSQDYGKTAPNDTNHKDTYFINTDISINHSENIEPSENMNDKIDSKKIENIKSLEKKIKENIGYDFLNSENPSAEKRIDEILQIIIDVIISERDYFVINKERVPAAILKKKFLQLDEDHIEYVLSSINNYTKEITNVRNFLISSLYNALHSLDTYLTTKFNQDFGKNT